MGRPLKWTPEQKLPLVLSVLRGEGSVAEIGRRHRVSDVTLAKWRGAFLAGGGAALGQGRSCGGGRRGGGAEVGGSKAAAAGGGAETPVWGEKKGGCPPVPRPRGDPTPGA